MKTLNRQLYFLILLCLLFATPVAYSNISYTAPPVERNRVKEKKEIRKEKRQKKILLRKQKWSGTKKEKQQNVFVLPPIWIPFILIIGLLLIALFLLFLANPLLMPIAFWAVLILGVAAYIYGLVLVHLYTDFQLLDVLVPFVIYFVSAAVFSGSLWILGLILGMALLSTIAMWGFFIFLGLFLVLVIIHIINILFLAY